MPHPAVQEAIDFLAIAEEIGDEADIQQALDDLNRINVKVQWTAAHSNCDHAYGICQSPHVKAEV